MERKLVLNVNNFEVESDIKTKNCRRLIIKIEGKKLCTFEIKKINKILNVKKHGISVIIEVGAYNSLYGTFNIEEVETQFSIDEISSERAKEVVKECDEAFVEAYNRLEENMKKYKDILARRFEAEKKGKEIDKNISDLESQRNKVQNEINEIDKEINELVCSNNIKDMMKLKEKIQEKINCINKLSGFEEDIEKAKSKKREIGNNKTKLTKQIERITKEIKN